MVAPFAATVCGRHLFQEPGPLFLKGNGKMDADFRITARVSSRPSSSKGYLDSVLSGFVKGTSSTGSFVAPGRS